MRIVSWNILQGGGKRAQAIGDALLLWAPDMLLLQEYRHGPSSALIAGLLNDIGLINQQSTVSEARKNCVFMASRYDNVCKPWGNGLDATLAMHVAEDKGLPGLEIFTAHMPHKRAQVPYFDALLDRSELLSHAALVIGDLNCGIPFIDSDIKTFANTHLFQAMLQQGWVDSWRSRHPDAREFTWISPKGNGYRYDHCLSSPEFDRCLTAVEYDHSVRESSLSDHSALLLDVDFDHDGSVNN